MPGLRRLLTLSLILLASAGLVAASRQQSSTSERTIVTGEDPSILITNALKVSIESWPKQEVSIAAESAGTGKSPTPEALTIKQSGKKIEISCRPGNQKPGIELKLRVPSKAVVEVRNNADKIEVREIVGEIVITSVNGRLEIAAPEKTSLDMQSSPRAVVRRQIGRGGVSVIGMNGGRTGVGPPFIKITAPRTNVTANLGTFQPMPKPVTLAAQTIVRRGGLMGNALRQSAPQLIRPQLDQTLQTISPEHDPEALKLETHLVNLNVSATDRNGRAIRGLKAEDFSVYEDGDLQQISFFSPEESPFNLVLLIDLSGSMRDEIELIKKTAAHFLDVIRPQDSVAVVTFTTDVTVVSALTKDRDDLRESIEWMLPPNGGTSFYDAVGYSLVETLRKVKGQRNAVIVISDGEDNAIQEPVEKAFLPQNTRLTLNPPQGSFLTFDALHDGVTEADATIYPVHLDPSQPPQTNSAGVPIAPEARARVLQIQSAITDLATKQLHTLADASGGRFYHANRIQDLDGVCEQVAAELRTVYSIAYTTKNLNFDGKFRRIQVKVNQPDVAVRTRPGYYAR